MGAQDW